MTPEAREGFDPDELAPWEDPDSTTTRSDSSGLQPIDWQSFWNQTSGAADWAIEPLLPAGRCTAVYSSPKMGKSLLALDLAAAAATGRSILGQDPLPPKAVLYVDMEMTGADLHERLIDLGYGPNDDLSNLVYLQQPIMSGLDSDLGGEQLVELAFRRQVSVVVIDTMARAVQGEENKADTYRAFYRYTGSRLKAAGIAVLRLDHQGKDARRGQRGSSGKDDDLDVVFRLLPNGSNMFRLTRTLTRVPWIAVELAIQREEDPHLRHTLAERALPAGTAETVAALDELLVPLDASATQASGLLKAAERGKRKQVVLAALNYRRTLASDAGGE